MYITPPTQIGKIGGASISYARSSAFSPAQIANLALWLDAADTSTITVATGVSQWDDKSGNNNHVTQGTGGLQPLTGTATLNGLNVLDFTSTEKKLVAGSDILSSTGVEIFAVLRPEGTTSEHRTFVYDHGSIASRGYGFALSESRGSIYTPNNHGGVEMNVSSRTNEGSQAVFARAAFEVGGLMQFDLGEDTEVSTSVSGVTGLTATEVNTSNLPTIGGQSKGANSGRQYRGEVAEILVYSDILSSADRTEIENYFVNKWGVT